MKPRFPFRLGSTSYVYSADVVPNVQRLAPLVDDVELVLFEVDDGQNNLPSPDVIDALNELAGEHDLTFTVHLPLDLRLASGNSSPALEKACRVIQCARPLSPWAYVVHLDGREIVPAAGPAVLTRWRDQAARSLELLGQEVDGLHLLAIENLESYDPAAFLPLLDRLPVSLCLDVGHFLKRSSDPLPYLQTYLERTRVVHLHGCQDGRDHRGLDLLPDGLLTNLLDRLMSFDYRGVLTLEVFTPRHFFPGRELILALMEEHR
ncbi:MAG: sugar phosphate isomerase/epimerase [Anaerolineae bacterium]|nr:sugar phosphate isomerase/epimerase [Anaerolineae bacterium]